MDWSTAEVSSKKAAPFSERGNAASYGNLSRCLPCRSFGTTKGRLCELPDLKNILQ